MENPCTFLLAKEKTWKHIFNTNSELSQNRTEKLIIPSKTVLEVLEWSLLKYLWHMKPKTYQTYSNFFVNCNETQD